MVRGWMLPQVLRESLKDARIDTAVLSGAAGVN